MKGIIERIDHKELGDGREYLSFQISGNRYSVWDKKYFGQFTEGMPVDFKFKKSGKYLNISEIEHDPDYKPGNNGNGNNNLFNYPNQRDLQILKTSCLKCATYLVNGVPLDVDKKVDLALDVAKRLEKYLTIVPVEKEESLLVGSGEEGRFEGEF
jgi:hypothetical protein